MPEYLFVLPHLGFKLIYGVTVALYTFLGTVLVASRVMPVLILKELFLFTLGELLSKAVEIMVVLPYAGFEPKLLSSALLLVIGEFVKLHV